MDFVVYVLGRFLLRSNPRARQATRLVIKEEKGKLVPPRPCSCRFDGKRFGRVN
jgi:hypothetical protein